MRPTRAGTAPTAQKDFLAYLRGKKPTVDAVLAANDEMAIGAARGALAGRICDFRYPGGGRGRDRGRTRPPIRDGRLDFTVYQDPVAEGAGAVEAAMALLGGSQPKNVQNSIRWISYTPVTVENVDQLFPNNQ